MKAMVLTRYGAAADVLRLQEVERPVPGEGRVLVRVRAASVNKIDLFPIKGAFVGRLLGSGLRRPKTRILGMDVAGLVEAVGERVTAFQPGDEVFGLASGTFAEYACASDDLLVSKPETTTFEEAAAVPLAAISALQGLRKGRIQTGQRVLVYGASGGVGSFAIQIARYLGADVTAVCSARNTDRARLSGAAEVIDYAVTDVTRGSQRYDLILAVNGHHSILGYRRILSRNGTCVVVGGSLSQIIGSMLFGPIVSRFGRKRVGFFGIAKPGRDDLLFIRELLASGALKPQIDRRYSLSETPKAIEDLEAGHAQGKLTISV
jgi:NADPH:quinone reductase-like Zn-dependent oxidoreductase